MDVLDSVIDDLVRGVLKGAIHKAVTGWAAQGYVSAARAPDMEAGMLDEVQVALKMWQAAQARKAPQSARGKRPA